MLTRKLFSGLVLSAGLLQTACIPSLILATILSKEPCTRDYAGEFHDGDKTFGMRFHEDPKEGNLLVVTYQGERINFFDNGKGVNKLKLIGTEDVILKEYDISPGDIIAEGVQKRYEDYVGRLRSEGSLKQSGSCD
ncbi:hypothetical protein HY448_00985 [Candidatus Pacearchaeota archaeon]|nr:hypothetical protein [Candidatus Pacearchaeota archaeon]